MHPTHSKTITVQAPAEDIYDLVSDVTRTGEWSHICRRCEWVDPAQQGVGAQFVGHNTKGDRQWQTTSTVVAADRGRRFAWEVGNGFVRWSYTMVPHADAPQQWTELTQSWEFLPAGLDFFGEQYGDQATAAIEAREQDAHESIPRTLTAIKEIAESDDR